MLPASSEMLAEEGENPGPGVLGRRLVVAEAADAYQRLTGKLVGEAVSGVGIDLDVGGDALLLDDLLQTCRCADAQRVAAAEAGHDGTCPVQRRAEIAWQRGAVERRRGAKPLGRHHQCELPTHTEAGDADGARRLRHGEQVVAGGQDVVDRTAPLGQHLAEDARDAACPSAARKQVRRDGDVSRCGDPARDRLVVRPVAEARHGSPPPRATGLGRRERSTARRSDRPGYRS